MTPRFTLTWVGLLLAFVTLGVLHGSALQQAQLAGFRLGKLLSLLPQPVQEEPVPPALPPVPQLRTPHASESEQSVSARKPALRRKSSAKKSRPRGVRVSKDAVRRLAKRRAIPSGVPVPAAGGRPAGLRLSGVNSLGIGLRDGDVLTQVAGVPATSRAAVVQAVLSLRVKRAPVGYGRFYRRGEPWNLAVEIPYKW